MGASPAETGQGESPNLEAILARATSSHAEFGLRLPTSLPTTDVYEAGLALDGVALRPTESGEMEREVALEAVMPVSRLQTHTEIGDWQDGEEVRIRRGNKRGVQLGTDRRDWGSKILNGSSEETETKSDAKVPLDGMGARPSHKDRLAAEATLRTSSALTKRKAKRLGRPRLN